jgi:imidazolonepropionase-like amidohydrolase
MLVMIKSFKINLICLLVITLVSCQTINYSNTLLIENVSIINVKTGEVVDNQFIRIVDEHIVDISNINLQKGDENNIIDATGMYVIPALWDMHVHFEMWDYEPMALLMVANGVLGARDMGGNNLNVLDSLNIKLGNTLPKMRLLRAGQILDGKTNNWPFRKTVIDSIQASKGVIENIQDGVDFIKVHQQLNRESFFAIAKKAKEVGITFSGHVPSVVTGIEASESGQNTIEHLTGIPWCQNNDCDSANATITTFKENNTYLTPTLLVYFSGVRRYTTSLIPKALNKYIVPIANDYWQYQDSINEKFMPPKDQRLQMVNSGFNGATQLTEKLFNENALILAGTDAGYSGVIPGFDLHNELKIMVENCGASTLQALQSSTILPAKAYNLDKDLGTIEKGKYADMLILKRNPLEDINATREINYIISNGELITKSEINKLLQKVIKWN